MEKESEASVVAPHHKIPCGVAERPYQSLLAECPSGGHIGPPRNASDQPTSLKSFLKWPGGKRWFVEKHSDFLPIAIPGRYIEPFLGGGSVFFALRPKTSLLADACPDLVYAYRGIRNQLTEVLSILRHHAASHDANYYYYVREQEPVRVAERAARFIYLNRTCFNGIYRVNKRGKFNVPMGSRVSVFREEDTFRLWSAALKAAELRLADFAEVIDEAVAGDFVFADPPYTVRHNNNGFIKYNEVLFSWHDQLRLHECLVKAKARGVDVLSTNANHESVRALYKSGFTQTVVSRYSSIAGSAAHREKFEELVIV
ncbi:Dam family site-specific DNA-(adenine-N6)-methyltransferase [Burkholderia sp. WP9]|uniref:DNA adenine methylase n=1 Tax=Burkholderia sp. WP9 TaxID=1500263 RepID=UPI001C4311D4|nr:Dam family site-specific DNA-(adenine-N6)-methyltransferase [Burkholderia sp. WP9]